MKKYLALIIALAMVFALCACGAQQQAPAASTSTTASAPASSEAAAPAASASEAAASSGALASNVERGNTVKSDETLVIELSAYPDFFWHPGTEGQNGTNEEQIIIFALLDRLVDYDEATDEAIPMLADTWEMNEEGNAFTFHIRQGVKMVDGAVLTADDVVWCFNLLMERCPSNDSGRYFESIEKVDDETVTLTFNCVAPDALKMLSYGNYGIVTEAQIEALGGFDAATKNPLMGVGKYTFKEAKEGEYVILERNEEYWDDSYAGYFKTIKLTAIGDSTAKVAAVLAGDADVAYDIPIAQAKTYIDNSNVRTVIYPKGEPQHLFFNLMPEHVTSDLNVRKAIAKCLNHEAIAAIATAGFGGPLYSYVSPTATYYVAGWTEEDYAQDIEGAKALLEEAGYSDANPLEVCVYTLPNQMEVYTVLQANLKQAGINLTINSVDMGGFVPAMLFNKSYDLVIIGDSTNLRIPSLPQFVTPGMSFGGPAAVLPDHEEILVKVMAAKDDDTAKAALAEYHDLLKEDYMCVNLYDELMATVTGAEIKGFANHERGFIDITTFFK